MDLFVTHKYVNDAEESKRNKKKIWNLNHREKKRGWIKHECSCVVSTHTWRKRKKKFIVRRGEPIQLYSTFALLYLFRDHTLEQKRRRKNETSSLVFFFPIKTGFWRLFDRNDTLSVTSHLFSSSSFFKGTRNKVSGNVLHVFLFKEK